MNANLHFSFILHCDILWAQPCSINSALFLAPWISLNTEIKFMLVDNLLDIVTNAKTRLPLHINANPVGKFKQLEPRRLRTPTAGVGAWENFDVEASIDYGADALKARKADTLDFKMAGAAAINGCQLYPLIETGIFSLAAAVTNTIDGSNIT